MSRQLARRDRVDVKNRDAVTFGNLLQTLVELHDLLVITVAHKRLHHRRARDVRNISNNYLRLRLLFQRAQDSFVVLRKLVERQTV